MNQTRILVVEDDPQLMAVTSRLLRSKGYHVDEAPSGETGLRMLETQRPHLVLLDIHLSDMNGLDVLKIIKSDDQHQEIFVILVTGLDIDSDAQATGLESGADGYIVRPISNRELLARVEAMIRIKKAEEEAKAARQALARVNEELREENQRRRKVAKALRQSEEILWQIAQNTDDVFWVRDFNLDRVIYVSPAYEKVWGRSPKELINSSKSFMDSVHPDDRQRVADGFARQRETQNWFHQEYRIITQNGDELWIRARTWPVRDETGNIYRMVGMAEDITSRKAAEKALIEAKEAAEAASLAKSNFLLSISHELRTPLNAVIGFADILKGQHFGPLNVKQESYLENIYSSGKHLLTMIDDILAFSEIETGHANMHPAVFHFLNCIQTCAGIIAFRARQKHIEIDIHHDKSLEDLLYAGDSIKIRQVVINLLANAIKFNDGPGTIRVDCGKTPATLTVRISDQGVGIAPENLERVFTPFFQVKSGTTDKAPGIGLGLSIAKKYVEMHGGRLWGQSKGPGQGSTFGFCLPLAQGAVSSAEKTDQERNEASIPG